MKCSNNTGTCGLSLDERKLIAFCVVGPASLLPKGIVTSPLIILILLVINIVMHGV